LANTKCSTVTQNVVNYLRPLMSY